MKVPLVVAAKLLEMPADTLRYFLQQNKLDIGSAIKRPNSSRWTYYISPKKLSQYTGKQLSKIEQLVEELKKVKK